MEERKYNRIKVVLAEKDKTGICLLYTSDAADEL